MAQFLSEFSMGRSGAVAGCALPGVAQQQAPTPLTVPNATIPIVGSDEVFPPRSRLTPSSMSRPAVAPPTRHGQKPP